MNSGTNTTAIDSSSSVDPAFPFERIVEGNTAYHPPPALISITSSKHRQNPRKKRSRMIRIDNGPVIASSSGCNVSKRKYSKKPDPSAPKITRPCSECGRKFWSWKALFGHMRCHPERKWRGIDPPLNFRRPVLISPVSPVNEFEAAMTEEDHNVADCLIMLSNSPNAIDQTTESEGAGPSCRFECSSCKRVFGSHQALGGHRASHKNVKGCFAITRSDEETEDQSQNAALSGHCGYERNVNMDDKMHMVLGTTHKCSICLRVFPSGQALGGHKRCHWEREESPGCANLDLNMPAPMDDDSSSSYSSGLTLDLRSVQKMLYCLHIRETANLVQRSKLSLDERLLKNMIDHSIPSMQTLWKRA